jgi:predicted GH43/DUF377 family glycosyl hydrolase
VLLAARDARRVVYRSARSLLAPQGAEWLGIVPRVVFPTGLDVPADGILNIY